VNKQNFRYWANEIPTNCVRNRYTVPSFEYGVRYHLSGLLARIFSRTIMKQLQRYHQPAMSTGFRLFPHSI